jgi:hypothetical protein
VSSVEPSDLGLCGRWWSESQLRGEFSFFQPQKGLHPQRMPFDPISCSVLVGRVGSTW